MEDISIIVKRKADYSPFWLDLEIFVTEMIF